MALNMQLVRRRRQQIEKNEEDRKKGKNYDELKEGENRRRILPPWKGSEDWRKFVGYHYNVLEKESVLCPKKTFNKPCPICEYNEELYSSDVKEDKEEAKKIRAKDRFFANVLNLDKNDGKVYIMAFGQTVEEQIINIMDPGGNNEKSEEVFGCGDITDPVTGRTLLIKKDVPADPTQTSYDVQYSQTVTKVANWEAIEPLIHNLDEYVAQEEYTYEEMSGMLDGTFKGRNDSSAGSNPAPAKTDSTPKESFGNTPKKEEPKTQVTESFEPPKGMTPPQNKPVESSQPKETISALDKLRARRAAQGK